MLPTICRRMSAFRIGMLFLTVLLLPRPYIAFAESGPNLVVNPSFEAGFVIGLDVPHGWNYFYNDPAAVGFHDDQWSAVVAHGRHSQLIEIHRSTIDHTYAGIAQTIKVVPGQAYWLALKGLVRTDDAAAVASDSKYSFEYAVDFDGQQDWQQVTNWVKIPWKVQARSGPADGAPLRIDAYEARVTSKTSRLTLFIRAHKAFADEHEGNFNLDQVQLIPLVPGREPATGSFGEYHSHSALDATDGDPFNALFVDAEGRVGIGTTALGPALLTVNGPGRFSNLVVDSGAVATEGYVAAGLALKVSKAGDTMSGPLILNGPPSQELQAATKGYVDSTVVWFKSGADIYHETGKVGVGTSAPATELDVRGTISATNVQITEGADLAERFRVTGPETARPGMVLAIDPDHLGSLRVTSEAYDRTVVGVISGAGGLQPGLVMYQEEGASHPVALVGRAYVWADAGYGAIRPGDLLTSSNTPGHAMRVEDYSLAQGAVLGKSMGHLRQGRGLVLVLLSLQ